MLSMSADTLESSASKEWAPVDYGHSRSSTPDSSASSRLAAQLERSAYRRSRSNIRRRQNSNNTSSNPDISDRKASKNEGLKNQQRNQSSPQLQDDFTKINGSIFVVEGPQKTSVRRSFPSDDDQSKLIPGNNASMNKQRATTEQDFNAENWSSEPENEARTLTAYPVSAYTVSRVTVSEEDNHSLSYTTDSSRKSDKVGSLSQRSTAHRGDLQNSGIYPERSSRQNGLPNASSHNGRKANDTHFETRGDSRVRFEESWEDTTTTKVEYKGENSAIANSSREDKGPNVSKYRLNVDKCDLELKERIDTNSSVQAVKHRQREERKNVSVNTAMSIGDEPGNRSDKKDDVTYRKNCGNVKRDVYKKADYAGTAQIVSELSRVEEAKSLGLRQLIRLHEVQIAEVAKSAASMKRLTSGGKVQEGRLVKVKAFPEIETKPAHVKLHTAKVSVPRKNASFNGESNGVTKPSRNKPIECSDVAVVDSVKNRLLSNSDEMLSVTRRVVKPKRHTVEIRRNKRAVHEEQKWKRHTTIGLVGIDHQENREAVEVNGWSPTGKSSKRIFAKDGQLEDEHTRKQQVEPEKQVVEEKIKKCDVIDVKTSRLNEINNVLKYSDGKNETLESHELEQNDVPPERPPLPENFYSSEDILERPLPPTVDATDVTPQVLQANVELNNEIIKPSVVTNAQPSEIPLSTSLPADGVPNVQSRVDGVVKSRDVKEDTDNVLGNSRTTREMYEERLARINLIPFDVSEEFRANNEVISSQCTSLESFVWKNNPHLDKNAYLEKLKTYSKQLKLLTKEKEELENKFELQIRDWKRKYEEQQKVANAYQKLEDRYRRRVEELQGALLQCRCSYAEERTTLLMGQSEKRPDPYFFASQTQSILDETEEWLKEQSLRSEIPHNSENINSNARITNENGLRGSLSDETSDTERVSNYKDIDTDIDQYNGTSV